jgi:hypothetical protein
MRLRFHRLRFPKEAKKVARPSGDLKFQTLEAMAWRLAYFSNLGTGAVTARTHSKKSYFLAAHGGRGLPTPLERMSTKPYLARYG